MWQLPVVLHCIYLTNYEPVVSKITITALIIELTCDFSYCIIVTQISHDMTSHDITWHMLIDTNALVWLMRTHIYIYFTSTLLLIIKESYKMKGWWFYWRSDTLKYQNHRLHPQLALTDLKKINNKIIITTVTCVCLWAYLCKFQCQLGMHMVIENMHLN